MRGRQDRHGRTSAGHRGRTPHDVFAELFIAALRRREFSPIRVVIGGRHDRDAVRTEHPTDRHDPEPAGMTVDVVHDQPSRRSSSAAAKNADTVFKMSLANRSCFTSALTAADADHRRHVHPPLARGLGLGDLPGRDLFSPSTRISRLKAVGTTNHVDSAIKSLRNGGQLKATTAYEGLHSQLTDKCRYDLVGQLAWLHESQYARADNRESRMPYRWDLPVRTAGRWTRRAQ